MTPMEEAIQAASDRLFPCLYPVLQSDYEQELDSTIRWYVEQCRLLHPPAVASALSPLQQAQVEVLRAYLPDAMRRVQSSRGPRDVLLLTDELGIVGAPRLIPGASPSVLPLFTDEYHALYRVVNTRVNLARYEASSDHNRLQMTLLYPGGDWRLVSRYAWYYPWVECRFIKLSEYLMKQSEPSLQFLRARMSEEAINAPGDHYVMTTSEMALPLAGEGRDYLYFWNGERLDRVGEPFGDWIS